MPLVSLVVVLIVIGVLLYLVNTLMSEYIDAKILRIINVIVVVAVLLWILTLFVGPLPGLWVGPRP